MHLVQNICQNQLQERYASRAGDVLEQFHCVEYPLARHMLAKDKIAMLSTCRVHFMSIESG